MTPTVVNFERRRKVVKFMDNKSTLWDFRNRQFTSWFLNLPKYVSKNPEGQEIQSRRMINGVVKDS